MSTSNDLNDAATLAAKSGDHALAGRLMSLHDLLRDEARIERDHEAFRQRRLDIAFPLGEYRAARVRAEVAQARLDQANDRWKAGLASGLSEAEIAALRKLLAERDDDGTAGVPVAT